MTSTNQTLLNSSTMNKVLTESIHDFAQQCMSKYQNTYGEMPVVEKDEQWPSPCEQGKAKGENIFWQPIEICSSKNSNIHFNNVETALNLTLHVDIKTYFTTIFSGELLAECSEGKLSLLFAWNEDDFQRLQENIIGHILMKQRMKQPETVFFAVTDEEDLIISIANDTGEVWVERVGCKPHKKLSNSVADFIGELKPIVMSVND
ncbi:MAG: SecY-interacting protein [Colwellia sp.]